MKGVKFEYCDGELDILDKEGPEDDNSILNYCETLGGHTLMIDDKYELVMVESPNLFTIRKKKVE